MIFCARATRGLRRPSLDARSGRSISPYPWRENERAWKGSGETASMVSVLAEPPRQNGGRSMRAKETIPAASPMRERM
jgi:hypothetical protein